MTTLDFVSMRNMLQLISEALGEKYVISCSWDGAVMTVIVRNPKSEKVPFKMIFDNEGDYISDAGDLINQLAKETKKWFGKK